MPARTRLRLTTRTGSSGAMLMPLRRDRSLMHQFQLKCKTNWCVAGLGMLRLSYLQPPLCYVLHVVLTLQAEVCRLPQTRTLSRCRATSRHLLPC